MVSCTVLRVWAFMSRRCIVEKEGCVLNFKNLKFLHLSLVDDNVMTYSILISCFLYSGSNLWSEIYF